jgi:ribosomal protein L16 Arg81 hydroxylase
MVAMSNNNEWLDDDIDIDDEYDNSSDLVKKLRRAAKVNEKRAKELEAELNTLRTEQLKNVVKSVLESKGVRPSIAKYIPEDVSTADDIDAWLQENAEDFGFTLGQPKQEADLATLRQIDAATANAVSPAGIDDMMLRLSQAESAEEVERLIFGG